MADQTVHVGAGPSSPPHAHIEARFVKVEGEVAGLKSDLGEIKSLVKDIGERFSAKGQINWAALALLAMILIPSLGWAWSQIGGLQTRIDNAVTKSEAALASAAAEQKAALTAAASEQKAALSAAITEQRTQTSNFETRAEIDKTSGFQERLATKDAQLAAKDAAIAAAKVDRLGADVDEIKKIIVPLSTHQELWTTQHKANDALAAQIDENRRALADITAPKETISRIYKRLDDVELLTRGRGRD